MNSGVPNLRTVSLFASYGRNMLNSGVLNLRTVSLFASYGRIMLNSGVPNLKMVRIEFDVVYDKRDS